MTAMIRRVAFAAAPPTHALAARLRGTRPGSA
jgi:hypothetical protein